MSELRATLFGTPEIRSDSDLVTGLRHKTIALFAYLAVECRPIGRDTLATLLWPHSGQSRARANLRSCIFQISDKLRPVPITSRNDFVELNPNACRVDVCEFRSLISHLKAEPDTSHKEGMLRAIEQLCRGCFMEGFTLPDCPDFDTWEFLNEELFRRQLTAVVHDLTRISASQQDWAEALRLGRRLIELDPLEESSHRLVMQILATSGQPTAAIRQYEECRHFLKAELDDEPEKETEDLLQVIKHGKLSSPSFSIPLAVSTASRFQLPPLTQRFFGRKHERDVVRTYLRSGFRLCTITGAAGAGKTRFAIESIRALSHLFPGGIIFIDLTRINSSEELPSAISSATGLRKTISSRQEILHALCMKFTGPKTLLLLDNFEHIIDAADFVNELVESSQSLYMLVTSRESLRIPSEQIVQINPFASVGEERQLAIQLFRDRAATLFQNEEIEKIEDDEIAAICQQLDGLPLAIELSVPLLKIFSVEELTQAVTQPLQVLNNDRKNNYGRHSSLQQAIYWSYKNLTKEEKDLFCTLGVFAGGFSLEAVKAVTHNQFAEGDTSRILRSLIHKSLVQENGRLRSGDKRFGLLEIVRQYARQQTENTGRSEEVMQQFTRYYTSLVAKLSSLFHGPGENDALKILDMEHANLQLTLQALYDKDEHTQGLELSNQLHWFWYRHGHFSTGESWLAKFLDKNTATSSQAHASGIASHAWMLFVSGQWRKANSLYAKSLYSSRQIHNCEAETRALAGVGVTLRWMGDIHRGNEYTEQAVRVARSTNDPALLIYALIWAYATTGGEFVGDPPQSQLEEAADLARRKGDQWSYAHSLNGLGDLLIACGEYEQARTDYQLSLQIFQELDDRWMIAWCEEGLGLAALKQRNYQSAEKHTERALALFLELGDRMNVAAMLVRIADIQLKLSKKEPAARMAGEASLIIDALGTSDEGRSPRMEAARTRCHWYEQQWPLDWAAGRRIQLMRHSSINPQF